MRKFELRTYHLRTEKAATAYLPHWVQHIRSLQLFGVETPAFFSAPSAARDVVALISFDEYADPEGVTREYMKSEGFKADMAGFDVTKIEGADTLFLLPGVGSPLA